MAWRRTWNATAAALLMLVCWHGSASARNEVLYSGGFNVPVGPAASFAASGYSYELRWRHWNRGRSAYEFVGGYSENNLEGAVQNTIADFEALVRLKNLAQMQGTSPGRGRMIAEHGVFKVIYVNANVLYRPLQRARFSPLLSVGGGLYNWRLPFRIKFFDVPGFGEQRPWLPMESAFYAADFPETELDFTKHQSTGGLNAAIGLEVQLSRHWKLGGEGRAHVLFSSGTGDAEEGVDDQRYLDNITFVLLQASLNYRF